MDYIEFNRLKDIIQMIDDERDSMDDRRKGGSPNGGSSNNSYINVPSNFPENTENVFGLIFQKKFQL